MRLSKRSISPIAIALAACALAVVLVWWRAGSSKRECRGPTRTTERIPSTQSSPSSQPLQAVVSHAESPVMDRPGGSLLSAVLDDAKLMDELRHARTARLAIQLARAGNQQFPDSPFAPERESILIHALAESEQHSEARGQAEYMVNHYPDSDWVREIERFTGAHRHRNLRLNDVGELEYD